MAKGKYADRARNKAAADRRHAIAVQEGNRLREQIHRLRHLEEENAALRKANEELRTQLKAGSTQRERQLGKLLEESVSTMDKMHANYQRDLADELRKWDEMLDELTRYGKNEVWWDGLTAIARQAMRMSPEDKRLPHDALKVQIKKQMRADRPRSTGSLKRQRRRKLQRVEERPPPKAIASEALLRQASDDE